MQSGSAVALENIRLIDPGHVEFDAAPEGAPCHFLLSISEGRLWLRPRYSGLPPPRARLGAEAFELGRAVTFDYVGSDEWSIRVEAADRGLP